jgi:hypothetical protein
VWCSDVHLHDVAWQQSVAVTEYQRWWLIWMCVLCVCLCAQTLLPLTPTGELCDLEGNCVDAAEDEIFKLTTQVRAVQLMWQCTVGTCRHDQQQGCISDLDLILV